MSDSGFHDRFMPAIQKGGLEPSEIPARQSRTTIVAPTACRALAEQKKKISPPPGVRSAFLRTKVGMILDWRDGSKELLSWVL